LAFRDGIADPREAPNQFHADSHDGSNAPPQSKIAGFVPHNSGPVQHGFGPWQFSYHQNRTGESNEAAAQSKFEYRLSRHGLPPVRIGGEPAEQLRIGGGESMGRQFLPAHPLQRRTVERLRFTGGKLTEKKLQVNCFVTIGVRHALEQFTHADFNAKLLAQFALQALPESFARLAFATGEFPQAAQMVAGMPLGDE
jgi:hypothetical protein